MAGSGRRPEHRGPPELFYDEAEARKYTQNSRVVEIQSQMSERAVELLGLPEDRACLLLDVGCGSGLSGDYISEEGHYWIGMDISPAMLDVAVEREVEGDLLLADVGHGIPFRPGMFDGCIRTRFRNIKGKSVKKSRDWILEKKERRRRQGKEVRADTKYTGRKRRPRF